MLYFDKNVLSWARLSSQEYPEKIRSGCGVDGTGGRWMVLGWGGGLGGGWVGVGGEERWNLYEDLP